MKPIIFIIASLVLSLSNFTIKDNFTKFENVETSNVKQNYIYQNQTVIVKSETIRIITCESCHGNGNLSPISLVTMEYLENNFDASLIVHQKNHPQHISGLEQFLNTHDEEQAWHKYVDYQKVIGNSRRSIDANDLRIEI